MFSTVRHTPFSSLVNRSEEAPNFAEALKQWEADAPPEERERWHEAAIRIDNAVRYIGSSDLDLAGLLLTRLPPWITTAIPHLRKLDLSGNKLTELPADIWQADIHELDLSRNDFAALPPVIGDLQSLKSLDLSGNRLDTLPLEIERLSCLEKLNLSGNRLTALPSGMSEWRMLEELDASGNMLNTLPMGIENLMVLKKLDLSANQFVALPPEIGKLSNLQKLNAADNSLASLPAEFAGCTALKELHLDSNKLTALPPEIGQLQQLRKLFLSGNEITALSDEIGKLKNLIELDLSDNRLSQVPDVLGRLPALDELDLSGNQVTALPPQLGQLTSVAALNESEHDETGVIPLSYPESPTIFLGKGELLRQGLNRWALQVEQPEDRILKACVANKIFQCYRERNGALDLSKHGLSDLPAGIALLTHASSLDLSGNRLISLPDEVYTNPWKLILKRFPESSRNPLSDGELVRWLHHAAVHGYAYSIKVFDTGDYGVDWKIQEFISRLLAWNQVAPPMKSADAAHWARWVSVAMNKEPKLEAFENFLSRLQHTSEYQNEATRPQLMTRVTDLLVDLAQRDQLRADCFDLAEWAQETCVDRIVSGLIRMEIERLISEARHKDDTDELLFTGADLFKMELLSRFSHKDVEERIERLASQIAAQRGCGMEEARAAATEEIDSIEVDLAYRHDLADDLELPVKVKAMTYRHLVDDLKIDEARNYVRQQQQNQEAMIDFLIGRGLIIEQDFWPAHLDKRHQRQFEQCRQPFDEELAALGDRLKADLAALKNSDAAEEKKAESRTMLELEYQIASNEVQQRCDAAVEQLRRDLTRQHLNASRFFPAQLDQPRSESESNPNRPGDEP